MNDGFRATRMERLLLLGLGLLLASWLLAGNRPPVLHRTPPTDAATVAKR